MEEYILVVDDYPSFRRFMGDLLLESGYRVKFAANGPECLKIAGSEIKPAIIFLDYQMPFMTGFEVLKALKGNEDTSTIPVVMISAVENFEKKARCYGATAVLAKPFGITDLIDVIQSIRGNNKAIKDGKC